MKFLISLLSMLFAVSLYGQTFTVSGIVKDKDKNDPMLQASVLFVNLKDSSKFGAYTDRAGKFEVKNVKNGRYNVRVSYAGYAQHNQIIIIKGKDLNLGLISLAPAEVTTGEVEVVAQMDVSNQNADTIQYNAGAFKVKKDAVAEDLVQKMPGVTSDGTTVKAQGETIKQVLVDGKQFFGEDPSAALKNLPAEIIDKVQIFDKQSDQSAFTGFDDGNTTKTMNIITKNKTRSGQFGNFNAGYGDQGKYSVGGSINLFHNDSRLTIIGISNNINKQNFSPEDVLGVMGARGGMSGGGRMMGDMLVQQSDGISTVHSLGTNFSTTFDSILVVNGSYFFNYSNNNVDKYTDRTYISTSGSAKQTYLQDYLATTKNINHRANLRFEYTIDSSNKVVFRPRFSAQINDAGSNSDANTFLDTTRSYINKSGTDTYLTGLNFASSLTYMHKFNSDGRSATLDLNYTHNRNYGDSYLGSNYGPDSLLLIKLSQPTDNDKQGDNLNANLTYSEPLTKKNLLQANYYIGENKNTSNKRTYDEDTLYSRLIDSALSNVFESKVIINRPGISYRYNGDTVKFTAGVNYEWNNQSIDKTYPSILSASKKYESFLPNMSLQYNISKEKNLRINYRASTNLPSIDKLQDVVDNSDPTSLVAGNPYLNKSIDHNLTIRYSTSQPGASRTFFAMANGTITKDYIGNSVITADSAMVVDSIALAKNARLTRPENMSGYYSLNSFITYGLPISVLMTNLNCHTFLNYTRTPSLINGEKNFSTAKSATIGLTFASNISENVDFTISSSTSYNNVRNTISTASNYEYYSQSSRANLNVNFWDIITSTISASHQYYWKLPASYNPRTVQLTLSLSKKFLANNQGELKLTLYDAFKATNSMKRNATDLYIENVTSNVLKRYAMLTFTYTIRHFDGIDPNKVMRDPKDMPKGPPPGGMGGPHPGGGPGGPGGPPPGGGFGDSSSSSDTAN